MSKFSRALIFQIASFFGFVALVLWLGRLPAVTGAIFHAQQKLGAMGFWGFALYPLLFAACNLLLLPGGILAVSSGLFFGLWWGCALMLCGNVLSAALSFVVS